MRAAVCERPGPPEEVLRVREVPRPEVRDGWSLVRVKGFGLNRSELMTRQGHSPNVRFPRVLGIECVGVVAESTDPRLALGTTVAAVMGEMGREFDGGYAEYALLPNELLIPLTTDLPWEILAALPETYLTAYGALQALDVQGTGHSLLIRGGTSSVGMAMLSLAGKRGLETIASTRNPDKVDALRQAGATHVVLDDGDLATAVRKIRPEGPDYVLELVGANTTVDSLHLVAPGGTVCVAGMLSGVWVIPQFEPVAMIPSGTKLTSFHSDDLKGAAGAEALQEIVDGVAAGEYRPHLDRTFRLDEIAEAHRYMEDNRAAGKVVVLTS
ncbi:zinc-binding dehydrogenase [Amycolatopsis rhizosphaerae]|uniref:Zinc-binding dehydrogenase n=1 Tax=Amycolatopsis rhizosphaerae TaxID=2053003 RepID=A0A558CCP1_9PSEU|nr:zinc-binding dehydrogenase [Amycolatopsis rhizosphaerae]TVT46543.1 zinc-binding dehydrogenase [Amycolatopsis rhizosphaerae]